MARLEWSGKENDVWSSNGKVWATEGLRDDCDVRRKRSKIEQRMPCLLSGAVDGWDISGHGKGGTHEKGSLSGLEQWMKWQDK